MVNFVEGCIDDGAPEINVNGVASIQKISGNQLMVSYYKARNGERYITARVIWDCDEWLAMWTAWDRNRTVIANAYFETPVPNAKSIEMH